MKSEARIQQECIIKFNNKFIELRGLLFHVPNGAGNSIRGKFEKNIGVVRGVSDLIFLYKGTAYLFELKTKTGVQSSFQRKWQHKVEENNFKYYIVRDSSLFIDIVTSIIKLKK